MKTKTNHQHTTNSLTGYSTMASTNYHSFEGLSFLGGTKVWLSRMIFAFALFLGTIATSATMAVPENGAKDAKAVAPTTATDPASSAPGKQTPGTQTSDTPDDGDDGIESALPGFLMLAVVIAIFVVPIFIGSRLAKSLNMPDHGWKIALAIGTIAAAVVVIYQGEIKFGPDLSGGITLIYELQDTSAQAEVSCSS